MPVPVHHSSKENPNTNQLNNYTLENFPKYSDSFYQMKCNLYELNISAISLAEIEELTEIQFTFILSL